MTMRWVTWPSGMVAATIRRLYGGRVSGSYHHLADRLEAVAAELDEIMFDQLREASAEKTGRPADDKRLTQARRAVEKAARLLRGGTEEY